MTSSLFWRTRSSQSVPQRKCCHGNSKGSTLKLLPFNKFLYIFRKSHQIWLNYLSPSLSYGQKTSRVVPNTPRHTGLIEQISHVNFSTMTHFCLVFKHYIYIKLTPLKEERFFDEILAIPGLLHKTIGKLSKFEKVPNFREGRVTKLGQNFV